MLALSSANLSPAPTFWEDRLHIAPPVLAEDHIPAAPAAPPQPLLLQRKVQHCQRVGREAGGEGWRSACVRGGWNSGRLLRSAEPSKLPGIQDSHRHEHHWFVVVTAATALSPPLPAYPQTVPPGSSVTSCTPTMNSAGASICSSGGAWLSSCLSSSRRSSSSGFCC